jgi:NAD(P)-dependent dehydrogenase (short-subunit alcohol dehydrogenase family)
MSASLFVDPSSGSSVPGRRLEGMSIVVTGAAGGIGAATCARLCAEGARVTAVDLAPAALGELKDRLPGTAAVELVAGDVTEAETAERATAAAQAVFGRVDGLVSVAGASGRRAGDGPVHECSEEGWAWTLQTNLTSQFLMARAALPRLIEAGGGSIVLLGSVLGLGGGGRNFATHAYAAAKAGTTGLARAMASYYATDGVRVNVVAPGLVATPMSHRAQESADVMEEIGERQPLGGIAQPDEVAGTIAYLLSADAAHTTGAVITIDGGWLVR